MSTTVEESMKVQQGVSTDQYLSEAFYHLHCLVAVITPIYGIIYIMKKKL
jgi:hypothetical protein